jgi:chaperonin GroES
MAKEKSMSRVRLAVDTGPVEAMSALANDPQSDLSTEGAVSDSLFDEENTTAVFDAIFSANTNDLRSLIAISGIDELRGLDLRGADLRGQDLSDLDLSGVDLRGADLRQTNLRGAKIQEAFLENANLTGVDLTETADYVSPTKMPRSKTPQRPEQRRGLRFRPLPDRVIVRRIDTEAKTRGGIIIPDTAKEKPHQGEVIDVGPGGRDEAGKLIPIDLKAGDRVLFDKRSGTAVKIDGYEFLIMRESDIIGVLSDSLEMDVKMSA